MHYQTTRKLARWAHFFIAFVQFCYIYTPLHQWAYGLTMVQWVTFPLITLSGLWLWRGQKVWLWVKNMQGHPLDLDAEEAVRITPAHHQRLHQPPAFPPAAW